MQVIKMNGLIGTTILTALVFTIAVTQRIKIFKILRNRSKHSYKLFK